MLHQTIKSHNGFTVALLAIGKVVDGGLTSLPSGSVNMQPWRPESLRITGKKTKNTEHIELKLGASSDLTDVMSSCVKEVFTMFKSQTLCSWTSPSLLFASSRVDRRKMSLSC